MKHSALTYGNVPVPWVASWSAECRLYVAPCRYAGAAAICQSDMRGVGKPLFGEPHAQRQRQAIAQGLCDLCGRAMNGATKVSLSHARPQPHAARIGDILQVEPLLHKACAAISMAHCPSLRRDMADGSLMVRQVTRYAVQMAIMSEVYVAEITGEHRKAIGHAKVQLLSWVDRDADWLAA